MWWVSNFQRHNWNNSRFLQHLSRTFPLEKLARTVTTFYRQVRRLPKTVFTLFFSTCDGQQKNPHPFANAWILGNSTSSHKTATHKKLFQIENFFHASRAQTLKCLPLKGGLTSSSSFCVASTFPTQIRICGFWNNHSQKCFRQLKEVLKHFQ